MHPETWRCPRCQAENRTPAGWCPRCGGRPTQPPPAPFAPATVFTAPKQGPAGGLVGALVAAGVVVVLALLGLGGYELVSRVVLAPHGAATPGATAQPDRNGAVAASPSEAGAAAPVPAPTAVGMVDVSAVAGDARAVPVGRMFDTYFGGIDSGAIDQALRVYDPAGVVDPTDPAQAAAFARAVATSSDSDVALAELGDDGTGQGAVGARVVFTSHQAAGYGPPPDTGQTCTRWDVTYVLSYDATAGYRILGNSRHTSTGC